MDYSYSHRYFIHPDHLGSWTLITDNTANIQQDVAYDAWGTPYRFTTTGTEPADSLLFDRGFTGHEHLSYFDLINMNGRVYDPFTSGFLSVDNYVQSPDYTQSFNRYSYCLNNPLKYTDPDGENPLMFLASTYFCLFTETGYEFQKKISPVAIHANLHLSTEQKGLGVDFSIGIPKAEPISYRCHYGATYYWKHYDNSYKGWEQRYGGEWSLFTKLNYSGTTFKSRETSQTTNTITIGGYFANIKYENDYMWHIGEHIPGVPAADNGDRYRSAAARIKFGELSVGVNLFTGDPGLQGGDDGIRRKFYDPEYDGRETYTINEFGNNPDEYRAGVFYVGLGSFKFGRNSESIRHFYQNILAHDILDNGNSPYFKVLDIQPRSYFYFGTLTGNSLW